MHGKSRHYYYMLCIICMIVCSTPLDAKETSHKLSTLTFPLHLNLEMFETYVDHAIPMLLTEVNEIDKVCVKPQYLKTKCIPKCHMKGFKIECSDQCIQIKTIPEIRCDIRGWVKRDGNISIKGKKKNMQFTFPIKAKISTDKPITATAEAAAILTIDITPTIHKNWSLSINAKPSFVWSTKPTAKFFELIEIDIQKKVEARLKQKIDSFVTTIPNLLTSLQLKQKMSKVWEDIQSPVKLDKRSDLYLYYKPQSISYSGFSVKENILTTTLSTQGETEIRLGKPDETVLKKRLPFLGFIPEEKGKFYFNVPISIPYQSILTFSNEKYLENHSLLIMKNTLPGIIKISNPKVSKIENDKLAISAHIDYENYIDVNGTITFTGTPNIDRSRDTLTWDDLDYNSTTNSALFDTLVNISAIDPLKSYFIDLLEYNFGARIEKELQNANESIKEVSRKYFTISANLDTASIKNIKLNKESMTIHTELSGIVSVDVDIK